MKPAESIAELEKQMLAKIANAMKLGVAEEMKDTLAKSARENVTGFSSRSAGGISDPAMMKATTKVAQNAVETEVTDEAPPQESVFGTPINASPTLFSQWIENGEWMDIEQYIATGEKAKRPARPFIEPAQEELEANQAKIEGIIKKYLDK